MNCSKHEQRIKELEENLDMKEQIIKVLREENLQLRRSYELTRIQNNTTTGTISTPWSTGWLYDPQTNTRYKMDFW